MINHHKLKELRLEKKITQEKLAQELNVSRKTISSWETGRNTPDFQTIQKLCAFYEISMHDMMENPEDFIHEKNEKPKFDIVKFSYYLNILLLILSFINSFEPFGIRLLFVTPILIINLIVYKINYQNWKVNVKQVFHNKEMYLVSAIFLFLTISIDLNSVIENHSGGFLGDIIIGLFIHQTSMLCSFIVALYFHD